MTGAAVFQLEAGLDTGPVFGTLVEEIGPRDTSGDLLGRLADAGAGLLVAVLDAIEAGAAHAVPQPADGVSLRAEDHRRGRRGALERAGASRSTAGSAPAPRPRARGPRSAASGSSSGRSACRGGRRAGAASRASCWWRRPGAGRHRHRAGRSWARCGRPGKKAMPAADWARGRPPRRRASGSDDRARRSQAGGWPGARRTAAEHGGRAGRPRARPPGATRPRKVDPARRAAYEALRGGAPRRRVRQHRAAAAAAARTGSGRDAALATELTYGTLRSQGQLDAVIAGAAGRAVRPDRPAGPRRAAAGRLPAAAHPGAARTPRCDHGGPGPGGRAGRGRVRQRGAAPRRRAGPGRLARPGRARPTTADPVGHLALVHAHPRVDGAGVRRGARAATPWPDESSAGCCAADNERPAGAPVRPARAGSPRPSWPTTSAATASAPTRRTRSTCPSGGARATSPAVADGRAHVQDEGSQLVALALADAPLDGPRRALAGPVRRPRRQGGAARRAGRASAGARLTAVEVAAAPGRAGRPGHRAACRSTWSAPTAATSAARGLPEGGFDRVLVDAPCTGLGSLRRRPESRWRRQPVRPAAADPAAARAARPPRCGRSGRAGWSPT